MPELPEVERTVVSLRKYAVGKKIKDIETAEDTIVYSGVNHQEFSKELVGRTVLKAERYGKVFYLVLDGQGRHPVLHFGMTGNIHIKGQIPMFYKEGPKQGKQDWPPRFMKFIMHLEDDETSASIAFVDARRLARIRLCQSPLDEPPISALGFDPILCMPSVEDFSPLVRRRTCPIKALLLDQSFSAGIGNWVADEVLYHSKIHPEQKCHTLTSSQIASLHDKIKFICETAVSLNADAVKFPEDWLFRHRWGKGKKIDGKEPLKLSSGEAATIKWITVGGRTSAFVSELQLLNASTNKEEETPSGGSGSTETVYIAQTVKRKRQQPPRNSKRRQIE